MNAVSSIIRTLADDEDHAAYLSLRARLWGRRDNPSDLDAYDRQAVVFGAFTVDGRLRAALRLVTPGHDSPNLEAFRRAVARHGLGGLDSLEVPLRCRIATEESFPITPVLDALERDSRQYVEIGRLMRSEHPGDPWAVIRLLKHAFAEAQQLGYRQAIAMCTAPHLRPWKRYGFQPVPGMPMRIERSTGKTCLSVWADVE